MFMSKPPKPPPTIQEAVRLLRKHSGQSQQIFSSLLGLSLRALQKDEEGQIPEPRALLRFAVLARDGGFTDLEEIFGKAAVLFLSMPGWKVEIKLEKFDTPADQPQALPDIRWRTRKRS